MRSPLDPETECDLVALALGYIEPKHRLNLIDQRLQQRILRARASFRRHLPGNAVDDVAFYDQDRVMFGASVRDNLLFGRIGYGIADAEHKVSAVVHQALSRAGLEGTLYRLGLDTESGIRGRYLPARLRQAVPLMQALIKAPQIAVLDVSGLLAISDDPAGIVERLRRYCSGMTLFLLMGDANLLQDVPLRVLFQGPTGVVEAGTPPQAANDALGQPSRFGGAQRMEVGS